MELKEKAAYLKGLAEGLDFDKETKEGKLIAALIDLTAELCEAVEVLDADMDEIAESAQMLSEMAKDLIITFEFHGNTLTYNAASAKQLLQKISRPNVLSQWQWPIDLPEEESLASIDAIHPWLYNVHMFSWQGKERLPLAAKADSWKKFLPALKGDRSFLLEFVQDDDPQNLIRDAAVLQDWLSSCEN